MIGAGLGIEALALYLGVARADLLERVAALCLESPHEEDVRRLIALWVDGVQVRSIAEALGRSRGRIYAKRRRIGLPARSRAGLRYLLTDECRAIVAPWAAGAGAFIGTPHQPISPDDVEIPPAVPLGGDAPKPDHMEFDPAEAKAAESKAKKQPALWNWDTKKGAMSEKDKRLAVLAFAVIRSAKIAEIMSSEFGQTVSKCAIDNKIFRMEIIRQKMTLSIRLIQRRLRNSRADDNNS